MTENKGVRVQIRAGTAADDDACGRIISAATLAAPTAKRLPHARALFEDASPLDPEGYRRLVAVDDAGSPCGFADFDAERAHIRYLFVDPRHQGGGIGQALIDGVQTSCGGGPLTLNCFAVNDRALAWYLEHGFRITGGGFDDLAGTPVVQIYLRREQGPDG